MRNGEFFSEYILATILGLFPKVFDKKVEKSITDPEKESRSCLQICQNCNHVVSVMIF